MLKENRRSRLLAAGAYALLKERSILLQNAINSLSKDYKTVIILRDIEQLSYEEIAIMIGIELGTVKSRIARARIELRNKLKEQ